MKKRVLSIILTVTMLLSIVGTAMAAPAPIASKYVIDGVTYYDVHSDYFETSTTSFIKDLLTGKEGDYDDIAASWRYLAQALMQQKATVTTSPEPLAEALYALKTMLNRGSADTISNKHVDIPGDDDDYKTWSVFDNAASLKAADQSIRDKLTSYYRQAGGDRSSNVAAKNSTLSDSDKAQTVFYNLLSAHKSTGNNKVGHYEAVAIVFSDFSLTTILPEDDGNVYETVNSEPVIGSRVYASNVKNVTGVQVTAQQEIKNSSIVSATSEINGSKEYGFEESISVGYSNDIAFGLGGNISVEVGFTASQVIKSGWSNSESQSEETSSIYNVSVVLPAHTNVMMKQSTETSTITTHYNCPVALNFAVTIVEYGLDIDDNDADPVSNTLATFGGNARTDLHKRAVIEKDLTDPQGIFWPMLYAFDSNTESIVTNILTKTVPMSTAGAKFTVDISTINSEVAGLSPIYAISDIAVADGTREYALKTGDYLFVDNIPLKATNRQSTEYYGFNQKNGHWVLLDENGAEIAATPIATLNTDPVSGYTRLTAGNKSGTVYLKYLIDEDCYSTAEKPDVFTKNEDLDSTAIVAVAVESDNLVPKKIDISGTLEGIAGDPAVAIEAAGLTAVVTDSTGKELDRPVMWEAKELESKGVLVENGQISFTKEGTFHIRATVDGIYSDWYEVSALPARVLAAIEIPTTMELDYYSAEELDPTAIPVTGKDQYGDAIAIPGALKWTVDAEELTAPTLAFSGAAAYTLTAESGTIRSNELALTVVNTTPYGITVGAVEHGTVTPDVNAAQVGTQITLTAAADENYLLTALTVTSSSDPVAYTAEGENTYTFTMPEAPVTIDATFEKAIPFTDVTEGQWFFENVEYVYRNGLMNGVDTTLFAPDLGTTRGMFVTILWRLEGCPAVEGTQFDDVKADAYYADAILWAAAEGIVNGYGDNAFGPEETITREQLATMMYRYAAYKQKDITDSKELSGFDDADTVSDWALDAVRWAVAKNIINGMDGGSLNPKGTATRAQVAAILNRYCVNC